jgi:hypothetical protein
MKFFQTVAYSLTVWLLAALINAFLIAVIFSVQRMEAGSFFILLPGIMASLFFSAPGIFCFWLVFFIAVLRGRHGQLLFRLLLATAICTAGLTGAAVGFLLRKELAMPTLITMIVAIAAAMLSLFAHRGSLIAFIKPSSNR